MLLSVIVVNTNKRELLRQALRALHEADLPGPWEVLVVDNVSEDGSAEMVEAEYPGVRLIRQRERRGPAANYNAGFRQAAGKYQVVLNEDAEVAPGTLRRMVEYMEEHPRVGMSGPRLVYPDGTPQQCCNRFPDFSFVVKRLLPSTLARGAWARHGYAAERREVTFEPDWIMATSLMMRRETLDQIGIYDEQFEIFYEETDLAARMRRAGWTVAWIADALVKHHHGVSNAKLRGDRDIHFRMLLYQSRYRYFRKHLGPGVTALLRALEAACFSLFTAKTRVEGLLPARRAEALLKARLYGSLARYLITGKGEYHIPPHQ